MRKPDNSPFCGHIEKLQLTSGNVAYGPRPEPDEEVEQRITTRGMALYGSLAGHMVQGLDTN